MSVLDKKREKELLAILHDIQQGVYRVASLGHLLSEEDQELLRKKLPEFHALIEAAKDITK